MNKIEFRRSAAQLRAAQLRGESPDLPHPIIISGEYFDDDLDALLDRMFRQQYGLDWSGFDGDWMVTIAITPTHHAATDALYDAAGWQDGSPEAPVLK